MRDILKKILFKVLQPAHKWYTSSPRFFEYKGIDVVVYPGVFFPKWILSTTFLLDHLETIDVKQKRFLELGAGSGIISFRAALRGAIVTASDISELAIEGLTKNSERLGLKIDIVKSDLFESIRMEAFDLVVINPPYYPKNPMNEVEMAWYCGGGFEYFKALFAQLGNYVESSSQVLMILSEDCNLKAITEIANGYGWELNRILTKKKWGEENFIFEISAFQRVKNEYPLINLENQELN